MASVRPRRFYSGVFLLSLSTLLLEIVETRLLSVVSWYHLAFFVISAAMFGMTAGAVWAYLRRDRFAPERLSSDLSLCASAFAVATAASLCLQVTLAPVMVFSVSTGMVFAVMTLAVAVPFFCSGVAMTLALTRSPFPIGRVYAVDLAGAASGCLGVIALLDRVDAPSAILLSGALSAGAAVLFGGSSRASSLGAAVPFRKVLSRPLAILTVLTTLGVANALTLHGLQPIVVKSSIERRDGSLVYERWNSFSRISVQSPPPGERLPLELWGPSSTLPHDLRVESKSVTIDGQAETLMFRYEGNPASIDFLAYDVTNLAYFVRPPARAAVIGVGSGRDVLSARYFGAGEITGVEINPILVGLLVREDLFARYAGLSGLRGLHLVTDEARSWFARTDETFDTIQMSMIDTWAATGAGAFTLSENGLYTVEAWKQFLDRLTNRGLFTVSRWYGKGAVNETGRTVSLAVAALLESGVEDPAAHIFLAASGQVATLVLSRSRLTPDEIALLQKVCARYRYTVLLSPGSRSPSEILETMTSTKDRATLQRYTSGLDLDLTPPTDDRPFFFNILPFDRPLLVMRYYSSYSGVAGGNITATLTLATILVVSMTLVTLTIVLPLRPAIDQGGMRLVAGGTFYFALLGVGFMLVEIALLQRLSVFLGHPVYSLSVVLFSLILATGAGSLLSDAVRVETGRALLVLWAAVLGAYLLSLPFWLPRVTTLYQGARTPVRALIAVALIAPAGLLMGFGFPTGMRMVRAIDMRPAAWFWGINGAAGVLGSVLAIVISIACGIGASLSLGALCYLLLAPASLALRSARPAR